MKKLVIVAHGIGDHQPDFYKNWETVIRKNTPGDYEIVGLYWGDVLNKVAAKYPIIEQNFADAVAKFGFKELSKILNSADYKKINDYFMDVLVYSAMADMTDYIQTTCAIKLKQIVQEKKYPQSDIILIGHSLGAAMLPHIVWRERNEAGGIPYGGMILLASPLGMESPIPVVVKDLLDLMPGTTEHDRKKTLQLFASEWELSAGPKRLHFLINTTDIVCWDVKVKAGPVEMDFIPIRQGFNEEEMNVLKLGSPGCVNVFTEGSTDAGKVIGNHDIVRYLNRPEFTAAFSGLIQ